MRYAYMAICACVQGRREGWGGNEPHHKRLFLLIAHKGIHDWTRSLSAQAQRQIVIKSKIFRRDLKFLPVRAVSVYAVS